jgi:signal transduction histidine kinase
MNNISKMKRKLTVMFTLIVFIIVSIFGFWYFTVKYFGWARIERWELYFISNSIESGNIKVDDLIRFWSKMNNNFKNNKSFIKRKWFINFLYISKSWEIISSDIKDNIEQPFINEVIQMKQSEKIIKKNDFFVRVIEFENWSKFALMKQMRYSTSDYTTDLILFLLSTFFLTIALYYIWRAFIDKTFIPVEKNINDMKEFVHNAWHELKTPISVLHWNLQILKDIKKYDDNFVSELTDEVSRLNNIIDWLIQLSDIDVYKSTQNISLNMLVTEIIWDYQFKISEKNIKINLILAEDEIIEANHNYFYIFLSNIIWNAIKYSDNNWIITIKISDNTLSIEDNWIWISEENLSKIFNRFYQCDTSRTSEWFWIWLSLVEKIANIYDWEIDVSSKIWNWTKFFIKFN